MHVYAHTTSHVTYFVSEDGGLDIVLDSSAVVMTIYTGQFGGTSHAAINS
jgi:hypothetical protein